MLIILYMVNLSFVIFSVYALIVMRKGERNIAVLVRVG